MVVQALKSRETESPSQAGLVSSLMSDLSYLRAEEVSLVSEACLFAAKAHQGQLRDSGDPYVTHPLAVASILAQWRMDGQVICAALLHDVLEDTKVGRQELEGKFGTAVTELVIGVSKFAHLPMYSREQLQAENFRKMLLAMAKDVRVIFIKLADRLHNLSTLHAVRSSKRRRIALETMDIYAPIANRLSLNEVYQQLQDLSFQYLYPSRFDTLTRALSTISKRNESVMAQVVDTISQHLQAAGIYAKVTYRTKHIYSTYRKMVGKNLRLREVTDLFGFRVIVKDQPSCYLAMGLLHSLYKPLPNKLKDYIAVPKANGYQSLHTTLVGPYEAPLEIQIRTQEMHYLAEVGVAAHWTYKDAGASSLRLHEQTLNWLSSLLDTHNGDDPLDLLESVKLDLFPAEVYTFTPLGKIVVLPRGSTALDFAYTIHSDIGNACVACRINKETAPLRTELQSGDQVEIITSPMAVPHPTWLNFVTTNRARSQIRSALRKAREHDAVYIGQVFLEQALEHLDLELDNVSEEAWAHLLRGGQRRIREDVFRDIGLGRQNADAVAQRLAKLFDATSQPKAEHPLLPALPLPTIQDNARATVSMAPCCLPIPGDAIVGMIQLDQGLVVHRVNCSNTRSGQWRDLTWGGLQSDLYGCYFQVQFHDKKGVLARVAGAIAKAESNIQKVSLDTQQDKCGILNFDVQVRDRKHLALIFQQIRRLPEVIHVKRP